MTAPDDFETWKRRTVARWANEAERLVPGLGQLLNPYHDELVEAPDPSESSEAFEPSLAPLAEHPSLPPPSTDPEGSST